MKTLRNASRELRQPGRSGLRRRCLITRLPSKPDSASLREQNERLSKELEESNKTIQGLKEAQGDQLVFQVEKREVVQKQIGLYEDAISQYLAKYEFAAQVAMALGRSEFDQSRIQSDQEELSRRIREVIRTGYPQSWHHRQQQAQSVAVAKAVKVKEMLDRQALREEAREKKVLAAPLPIASEDRQQRQEPPHPT